MSGGFGTGKVWVAPTGAGAYGRRATSDAPAPRALPDGSDLASATVAELVVTFCTVMDGMQRTNNTSGLAELSRYAGRIWWEMTGRGVEFK